MRPCCGKSIRLGALTAVLLASCAREPPPPVPSRISLPRPVAITQAEKRAIRQIEAGFGSNDVLDILVAVVVDEAIDRFRKRLWGSQQRRDIAKQDSRLGEIGNISDEFSQI